jgi:hypothetical protein
MRMYSGALPGLSVAWVEVLIRHFELTHSLWRTQGQQVSVEDGAYQRLLQAVARLRHLCLREIAIS